MLTYGPGLGSLAFSPSQGKSAGPPGIQPGRTPTRSPRGCSAQSGREEWRPCQPSGNAERPSMAESEKDPREHDRTATLAVWAGEGGVHWQGATQVPVVHSVSFGYEDLDRWRAVALGEAAGHIYGRNTNPTVAAFEEKLRVPERAEAATSCSTRIA